MTSSPLKKFFIVVKYIWAAILTILSVWFNGIKYSVVHYTTFTPFPELLFFLSFQIETLYALNSNSPSTHPHPSPMVTCILSVWLIWLTIAWCFQSLSVLCTSFFFMVEWYSVVCIYDILFIPCIYWWTLGLFHVWAIINSTALVYKYLYLRVQLLAYMVIMCFNFLPNFSVAVAPFYILTIF